MQKLGIITVLILALAMRVGADEIFVRVNQAGYQPTDVKVAVAMGRTALPSTFKIFEAGSEKSVYEGKCRAVEEAWGGFKHHAEVDFSRFEKEGEFVLRLGTVTSRPIRIRKRVYAELPDQLLEFMRQQRCGFNPWVDAVCHSFDGRTVDGPMPAGTYIDARGGWHDAGDQLKYLLTASNATAQMLLAYQLRERGRVSFSTTTPTRSKQQIVENETRPRLFADQANALGQPRPNGVADLLDEARWGLDWMLRLHPAPDQLYHQVADDRDHSTGFRSPQNETVDYGWGPGSYRPVYSADGKPQGLKQFKSESNGVANLAGRYAAAMALAYQIWKDDPHLRPFAERCLVAGREVYSMGKKHEGVQQGNSYKAPYRYAETTWADDMEWGAAELLRATGEQQYKSDAIRYSKLAGTEGWFDREKIGHYQYYPFMNIGHFRLYDQVDDANRAKLAGYYREQIEACVKRSAGNPYRIGVPFIWCSNNLTTALATECSLYERMRGDGRYRAFTAAHRDWLVGRNPWGFSMFTEIPASGRFPRDVHLFGNAVLKRSIRGGLVDGPVRRSIFGSLKGVSIKEPDPLAAFQDDRAVYHDDIGDYSTNEPTMDGTASAILMWVVMQENEDKD
jgi:endoglucanase